MSLENRCTLMAARIPADGKRGSQPVGVRYPTATGVDAFRRLCRGCPDWRSVVVQRHASYGEPELEICWAYWQGTGPMEPTLLARDISKLISLERKDAVSAIQIICAVAVPLLWGYQFVAIKVGVMEFVDNLAPRTCLRAACSHPMAARRSRLACATPEGVLGAARNDRQKITPLVLAPCDTAGRKSLCMA